MAERPWLPAAARILEAKALVRQATLMVRGPFRRESHLVGKRVVVFLHGFMANGEVLRPLACEVQSATGLPTGLFSSPLRVTDFHSIVDRFEDYMATHVSPDATVSLVGHSLGGLVARWYTQERGGEARVDRIVTLATPHRGTDRARWAPAGLRDALRQDGPVLGRLNSRTADLRSFAVVAGEDRLVVPPTSAGGMPGAEVITVPGVGHNEIIYHPRVYHEVVRVLARP